MVRLFAALVLVSSVAAPAMGQTKPATLAARVSALEKENAELRSDVDRLQALLTQTRRDIVVAESGRISGYVAGPAGAPTIQPQSLAAQQAQTNAAIQQQTIGQQLNTLQLQQGMIQDRQREQQLFQPTPFGATP